LVVGIDELYNGPNLCKFTKLEYLYISGGQGQWVSSLAELTLLETLIVDNCKGVCVLPALKKLSRLRNLEIHKCEFEDWSNLCNLASLVRLDITYCNKLEALPNLQELSNLKEVTIKSCAVFKDLHGIHMGQNSELLWIVGNSWLHENLEIDLY